MTVAVNSADLIRRTVRDLPPLPRVVQKLVRVVADDRVSAADVSRILGSDQALAGKILKLVNSPFYGQSGEIATVTRAVVVLGFSAVRNLALGLSAAGLLRKVGPEYQLRFWRHSLATAAAAEVLSCLGGMPENPEEAFVAGLLHDVGHAVMAMIAPREFAAAFAPGGPDLLERERAGFGLTHAKAGQLLLKRWKLPDELCDAVRFHHNPQAAPDEHAALGAVVALADMMANVIDTAYERGTAENEVLRLVGAVRLPADRLLPALREASIRLEECRTFLQVATDGEVDHEPLAPRPPRRAALACTDADRALVLGQVFEYHRCPVVPLKAVLTGEDVADVIVVDRPSVSDSQLAQLAPLLRVSSASLRAVADPAASVTTAVGRSAAALPLLFSRDELD
ncbi:MAG TPA: HDOD domain-containing protein [Candidatus Krumholzibacteria bacterium]|nr:HDOD domain-containing protein [Candidatus Krumholzibacteria bacterium]